MIIDEVKLKEVVKAAIIQVGLPSFKSTSMFLSNEKGQINDV